MIENLNDVIECFDELSHDYEPFTPKWQEIADCIVVLTNMNKNIESIIDKQLKAAGDEIKENIGGLL